MTPTQFLAAKRRFVQLLVQQGCNVQPSQQVYIHSEPSNLDLVEMAAEACYARGARYVDYDIALPKLERLHAVGAPPSWLTFQPTYKAVQIDQIVDSRAAVLYFFSQDEPDLYADFDETGQRRLNEMLVARRESSKRLREEGMLQRQVAWCAASPPSLQWAAKVFPELPPEQAVQALWTDIFSMTFADREDCQELWAEHLDRLDRRADLLNARKISRLRFLNPQRGTDLRVSLSPRAHWVSARKSTASGIETCANIPTFEVYTTPDWRGCEGTVGLTRPVMINGTLVEGLWLRFAAGELVEVRAERNLAAYEALINTPGDPTAKRLGEVALVGVDSPIFQSGRIYRHAHYDENAACHIATGLAYMVGLEGGEQAAAEELDALGCNRGAKTHQDVMISDETTQVFGDDLPLLVDGRWVEDFA